MIKALIRGLGIAVMMSLLSITLAVCGPSAEQKAKKKAECAANATESAEVCKKCCREAGFSGQSWMGGFLTGGKATCTCM